jgi:hypothetical protein
MRVVHLPPRRIFYRRFRERVFGVRVGTGTRSGGGLRRKQAMVQQTQQWRSGNGEMSWLSMLVDTMDTLSRPELRAMSCDPTLLVAVKAHLARPAAPCGFYGSNFSLRN